MMKTPMKKWGLLFAGCTAMLWTTGCSDSEPVGSEADEQVEIVLNADFSGAVSGEVTSQNVRPGSRAVQSSVHKELQLNFARIDMDASGAYPTGGYSASSARLLNATLAECTANQGTNEAPNYFTAIAFDPKEYYLVGRDNTKNKSRLIGWYPRATPASGVVKIDVDGTTDILLSNEVEGNKVAPCGEVSFKHVLTQLKVNAYALDEAAKTKWGAIESIRLKTTDGSQGKFYNKWVITLPTSVTAGTPAEVTVGKEGETTTGPTLAMRNIADDLELKTDADNTAGGLVLPLAILGADKNITDTNARPCGYAMFTPFAANEKITLEIVTTEGGTQNVPVEWANGYEAGKSYTLTLKFTVSDIALKGEITAWSEYTWPEGGFDGEIEI